MTDIVDFLNAYGPISWAFAVMGVALLLSTLALISAQIRFWLALREARRRMIARRMMSHSWDDPGALR